MVTNYPHRIVPREGLVEGGVDRADDGFVTAMATRIRQMFCAVHGHDNLLQFERDRLCLKCVSCGHESPGWELSETPPAISARPEPRRQPMVRPQLVGARRIA
jgi:hypothetical protein